MDEKLIGYALAIGMVLVMVFIVFPPKSAMAKSINNIFGIVHENDPLANPDENRGNESTSTQLLDVWPSSFNYGQGGKVYLKYQIVPYNGNDNDKRDVSIEVFDLNNDLAATRDYERAPGTYTDSWDGNNNEGEELPNGIYFIRLKVNSYTSNKTKIVKLE